MHRMTACPQVRVSYGIFSGFLQSRISFQLELTKFRRFAAELALAGGLPGRLRIVLKTQI